MLRKARKLNLSWEENRQFFKEFLIYRGPGLVIYFNKQLEAKISRLAVVVGKRVSKSAVVRNGLKRQLYISAERFELSKLGLNLVLVAQKKLSPPEYDQIIKSFTQAILR